MRMRTVASLKGIKIAYAGEELRRMRNISSFNPACRAQSGAGHGRSVRCPASWARPRTVPVTVTAAGWTATIKQMTHLSRSRCRAKTASTKITLDP